MEDRISLCSQILLRYGRFQLKRSPAWISQKIATFPNDDMCCYLPRSPSPASREAALFELLLWLLWFCFSIFSFYLFPYSLYNFFPPDIFLSPSVVCMSRLLRLWHDTSHSHQAGLSLVRSQNTGLWLVERQTSGSIVNTGDYSLLSTTIKGTEIFYLLYSVYTSLIYKKGLVNIL